MKKLPLGQRPIEGIPLWGRDRPGIIATIPNIDRDKWTLKVEGEIEKPIVLDWTGFASLGVEESVTDFHCVEGWSVLECRWEGVPFRNISTYVRPRKEARFVEFGCYDGYATSLPLDVVLGSDVLLACKLDGKWLEPSLGGPVRLVVPERYAYKECNVAEDHGFQEVRSAGILGEQGLQQHSRSLEECPLDLT